MARPTIVNGTTVKIKTGCGNMYVTINENEGKIFEVFAKLGKSGSCPTSNIEAITRLITIAVQNGSDINVLIKHLLGIRCTNPIGIKNNQILSCSDAIGKVLSVYVEGLKK